MMYITHEEFSQIVVVGELVSLTEGKSGEPNREIIEAVNVDACAEVEGYLRGVYALPLETPIDRIVANAVASIMKFLLYKRRDERTMPDGVVEMYKLTVSKLKDIQSRKIVLDAPSAKSGETVSKASIAAWTPEQKFGNHFTKLF